MTLQQVWHASITPHETLNMHFILRIYSCACTEIPVPGMVRYSIVYRARAFLALAQQDLARQTMCGTLMKYTCTTHGIHHYHAQNMPHVPVQCMEYTSTTHGIHLYHTWNIPVSRMEYVMENIIRVQTYGKTSKCHNFNSEV